MSVCVRVHVCVYVCVCVLATAYIFFQCVCFKNMLCKHRRTIWDEIVTQFASLPNLLN